MPDPLAHPLPRVLTNPPVLATFLTFLDWPAFHAILDTSQHSRRLFSETSLRDVVLSRFVPGYDACRDPALSLDQLVPIDIHHLHLFLISQNFPVHLYPTYALRTLFSLQDINSEPLASLTQAHSRFTLLLQSLIHFSPNFTIPPEQPHAHLFEKLSPSLPELTSPAPLSYKSSSPSVPYRHLAPQPSSRSHRKLKSPGGSIRRLTLLDSRAPPPPPPPAAEPPALKAYSSSWRRSWRGPSSHRYTFVYSSDSENELAPPRRRYINSTPTSISNSRSSLSRSSTPTPPASTTSSSPPPSRAHVPSSPLSTPSPYDFVHAMSPARAPVLRVYVPCSSPTPHPQTIIRCEEQLITAELWKYLSVGDIVANLGHVPVTNEPENSPKDYATTRRRRSLRAPSPAPERAPPPPANWLVFNGTFLVPFSATRTASVPVPDALTLPSPFYYTHMLPRLANPVFTLRRMPRFSASQHPSGYSSTSPPALSGPDDILMRLVHLPSKVPTVHGNGAALVRRYKWLTRVFVHAPAYDTEGEPEPELGAGWQGEWILEGDGTKEGREALADWLVGRGRNAAGKGKRKADEEWEWEWELVRERCEKGRIWMKLVNVQKCSDGDSETVVSESLL